MREGQSTRRRNRIIFLILICISAAVFLFCAIMLLDYYSQSKSAQDSYQDLSAAVAPLRPTQDDANSGFNNPGAKPAPMYETVTDPDTGLERQILREYAPIYRLNSHTVGWIRIPGTNIDYPVVQTPQQQNYYLRRDFYGNRNNHGCIYAKENCSLEPASDNIVIYGHRMKDQTMFAALGGYADQAFWVEHTTIYFDTLTQRHTYEVICVMLIESSADSEFQFQNYNDFISADEFDHFWTSCQKYALYDTGVVPSFEDKLITLSTCDYSLENGRLVVIARQTD